MTTKTIKLETRLCISENDPCALCGRRRERIIGMTETYVAATL
jgi:hypothetical protein